MGALFAALLLLGDFWPKVAQTPYDALLSEGARLRAQAERSCMAPITCKEGSPAFLAQQAGLRQAAAAFQHAAALRPEDPEAPFFAGATLQEAHDYEAAVTLYEESRRRRADGPREFDICFELGTAWAHLGKYQRSVDEYMRGLQLSHEPHDRIHNCQVLHYTRQNPANPTDIRATPMWMRSVCPWNVSLSSNEWRTIARGRFTNADLLREAEDVPRHTPEELDG